MTTASLAPPLTVLQLHNYYRWGGTGEDDAVRATCALLRARGVRVHEVTRNSREVRDGLGRRLALAASGVWSRTAQAEVEDVVRAVRPDIAHVHNVYPMLSPSVIAACARMGVPVVMTCHNYRLICPTGGVFRDGQICTKCTGAGGEAWCVVHNCRGRITESAAYALRSASARWRGTFATAISRYMTPSRFTAGVLEGAGIPGARIDVVPCMVPVQPASARRGERDAGDYVAFAGRLSEEKGLDLLLRAAASLPAIPFRVAGDGPLREQLEREAPANVAFDGYLQPAALAAFYRRARLAVVPSLWYETFGLVPAEAMSHGVPVVASRFGALPELVTDNETGLLFRRGDAADLGAKIASLWEQPGRCTVMGSRGRASIAARCSPDAHLAGLLTTYRRAMTERVATPAERRRSA